MLFASEPVKTQGAQTVALAGAGATLSNNWSVYNNPAGLAGVQNLQLGFVASNPFGVDILYTGAVCSAIPLKKLATIGLGYAQLSFGTYQSYKGSFGLARSFGPKVMVGLQLHYNLLRIDNYDPAQTLIIDAGIRIQASEELAFAVQLYNPFANQISTYQDERWPSFFRIGAAYKLADQVDILAEIEANGDTDLIQKIGLKYELKPNFHLQAGISGLPIESFFGASISTKSITINISFGFHTYLGATPYFGLDYAKK